MLSLWITSSPAMQAMGLFGGQVRPFWWPARMLAPFESLFRKVQDGTRDRLDRYPEAGRLKGFLLAYLGQRDELLPVIPDDLIRRQEVQDYPTDFSPMKPAEIDALSRRGEQLARLLVDHYLSELV
ncbi:MAG: hypothetical protein DMG30_02390 [Acidobacteria bacterium]|nr:MAG: hypothetical protein DMG30_02390 [Acidobacteriota bacterium]